jgi:LPS-assembly protein
LRKLRAGEFQFTPTPGALLADRNQGAMPSFRTPIAALLLAFVFVFQGASHAASQTTERPGTTVQLEADEQRKEGNRYIADGNVQVRHEDKVLRADHAEYDDSTGVLELRGHVQFDSPTQHVEAEQAHYDVNKGSGSFANSNGLFQMPRQPNPAVLLSDNPLYFEAAEVRRINESTYEFEAVWLTICLPERPLWKFFAPRATLYVDNRVALVNANFRLLRVPLFYTPYASVPAGRRVRQSGFTIPDVANTTNKGLVLGESFYWAPLDWLDVEIGAELYTQRGWSQSVDFRARPSERSTVGYEYFGVQDRGQQLPNGRGPSQSGHQSRFFAEAFLGRGWRAVVDINELSSLNFRLAWAATFSGATVSELVSAGFLTNNFRGFSFNFTALGYKDFLSRQPGDTIQLRKTPQLRFGSVEQRPWERWPVYLSFDAFTGANYRSDPIRETPTAVERSEFAPRVTIPLHWGPWLGVTTSATGRATHYGAQLDQGSISGRNLTRTTGEISVEIQTPVLEREWGSSPTRWKHTIGPEITYTYVTGVDDFSHILRFDQSDTLSNSNDVEYGVVQRLFRKGATGSAQQFLSWRVAQKYFLDPTFGGALVAGQRNVFAALSSVTPFAFADAPRRWSPIISDFKITPGGRYDFGLLGNFDPVSGNVTALGTLANIHPYRSSFLTLSRFKVRTPLQPQYDQLGMRAGWGQMNRQGFNFVTAMAYDLRQHYLQHQAFQVSYNGSCCGLSFEYRRLALGPVRTENQFRVALLIANFGSFGTLRRQESLF